MIDSFLAYWDRIIVPLIAIYGALLSTVTLWHNLRKVHRRIKVEASFGTVSTGGEMSEPMIFVTARNFGEKPVRIVAAGLKLRDKKEIMFLNRSDFDALPHDLLEGLSCTSGGKFDLLKEQLRKNGFTKRTKVRPFVRNDLGEIYHGKEKEIELA